MKGSERSETHLSGVEKTFGGALRMIELMLPNVDGLLEERKEEEEKERRGRVESVRARESRLCDEERDQKKRT